MAVLRNFVRCGIAPAALLHSAVSEATSDFPAVLLSPRFLSIQVTLLIGGGWCRDTQTVGALSTTQPATLLQQFGCRFVAIILIVSSDGRDCCVLFGEGSACVVRGAVGSLKY
jgi:hypothetical protein